MIRLDVTEAEAATLAKALEYYLSELRMEVADTDRQDMRDALKAEKEILNKILSDLKTKSGAS